MMVKKIVNIKKRLKVGRSYMATESQKVLNWIKGRIITDNKQRLKTIEKINTKKLKAYGI
jgi:hypothetical protein